MEHPDKIIRKNQKDYLARQPEKDREYEAQIFRIGNAACNYYQLASCDTSRDFLEMCYKEWLEGLSPPISAEMKKKGFEGCRAVLAFKRYVNERKDIGMDEWMKAHLSEEDYKVYLE